MKTKDLKGQRFGRLVVIEKAGKDKTSHTTWLCKCDCGTVKTVTGYNLINGSTLSCGCYKNEKVSIHGKYNTRIYRIWNKMKGRCNNKRNTHYDCYGGRGIRVCDEWLNDFQKFYKWSVENEYNNNLTIDRIDVDGNYEPNNCRWVSMKVQANNRRTNAQIEFNGKTQNIAKWAEELGINKRTLSNRFERGWTLQRALSTPVKKRGEKT